MENDVCDIEMDQDEVVVNQSIDLNKSKNNDMDVLDSVKAGEITYYSKEDLNNADELISVHSLETGKIKYKFTAQRRHIRMFLELIEFYCPCEQNYNIEFSEKIQCPKCSKYQHSLCLGYISSSSLTTPYLCPYCTGIQNKSFDKFLQHDKQKIWKKICCIRLFLYHCYKFKEVPISLVEMMDGPIKKDVLMFVKDKKLMKMNRGTTA